MSGSLSSHQRRGLNFDVAARSHVEPYPHIIIGGAIQIEQELVWLSPFRAENSVHGYLNTVGLNGSEWETRSRCYSFL